MATILVDNKPDQQRINELAQEGWIAMWKALKTYDPEKWKLAPWLTYHAKDRMRQIVIKDALLTGQPGKKGHVRVPFEPTSDEAIESKLKAAEMAGEEFLELTYHQGEIYRAISELAERDRIFVHDKILADKSYHGWRIEAGKMRPVAKEHLRSRLEHLREYA